MPGMQIFAKVVSNDNWITGGGGGRGGGGGYRRDTFYVWLYPVEQAWPIIAQGHFYGGGPPYRRPTATVLAPRRCPHKVRTWKFIHRAPHSAPPRAGVPAPSRRP